MAQATCSIDGCPRPEFNRTHGWCEAHYRRNRRHGTPLGGGVTRLLDPMIRVREQTLPPDENGCILWTGVTVKAERTGIEYGSFKVEGRSYLVHRWVYERTHNLCLIGRTVVRHTCDVPLCVNSDHLLSGTQADNIRDCIERGRAWWQNR